MIRLSVAQLTEIKNHGKEAYPEECCGAMLGELESSASSSGQIKFTKRIVRIENNWGNNEAGSRHRRFAITAKDYQELEETAKKAQLVLLGFYHTHPDHPAKPSALKYNRSFVFYFLRMALYFQFFIFCIFSLIGYKVWKEKKAFSLKSKYNEGTSNGFKFRCSRYCHRKIRSISIKKY